MFKNGFDINNLQWLMCHKTKPNQNYRLKVSMYPTIHQ